jgi:regulator of sirC expression with transglutaminase-like and TPR domain
MVQDPVNYLRQILAGSGAVGRMDRAALDLASIHFPDLQPEPVLRQLNELASQLGDRIRNFNDGREFVEKAQRFLFGELGFRGNQGDYFDPLNSCLNQVLERRTGIPITLSLLYMEIARRLHMPVFGIDLPRHFVLQFDDGNYSTYIDPFHGGKAITPQECFVLAEAKVADPALLRRASSKGMAMRMLLNLQHVYLRSRDFARAVATLDLLLVGAPDVSEWYKLRGLLLADLGRLQAACRDLQQYLAMEPSAPDRDELVRRLNNIRASLRNLQ